MNKLSVRVPPHGGESLPGFLLRLAKVNGLTHARQLLNTCEIRNVPSWPRLGNKSTGKLMFSLAEVLSLPVETMCSVFNTDHNLSLHDPERYIRNTDNKRFQCCPGCMQEAGYHKAHWNNLFSTFCHRHKRALIDSCPACERSFKWEYFQLEGCQCGLKYEDMKAHDAPLEFETQLDSEIKSNKQNQIDALCKVLCHVLNNYDPMFGSIADLDIPVKARRHIINYAYGLIVCETLRSRHCGEIERQPISHEGLALRTWLENLNFNNKNVEVSCTDEKLIDDYQGVISPKRVDIINTKGVPSSHHIGVNETSFLLGVSPLEIRLMAEDKLALKPLATGKKNEHIIFDKAQVYGITSTLLAQSGRETELVGDLVSLDWVSSVLLPLYKADIRALLYPALRDEIPLFKPGITGDWRRLLIQRSVALKVADRAFTDNQSERADIAELSELFGTNESLTQEIVRQTPLIYSKWARNCLAIDLSLAKKFLDEHILLSRYCALNGLNEAEVIPLVSGLPVEYPKLRQQNCYVFKRSAQIEAILEDAKQLAN